MTTPIPARLAKRPTVGGLVQPWVNVELAGGGVDFRVQHRRRAVRCWMGHLCQVCSEPLGRVTVFLGGPEQLRKLLFDEPGLHPECALYVSQACPMVAGGLTHYAKGQPVANGKRGKTCPDPTCDCGGWVPHSEADRAPSEGGPAHDWYAVYVRGYSPGARPNGEVYAGVVHPGDVVKVFHVSTPGAGRTWVRVETPTDLEPALLDPENEFR